MNWKIEVEAIERALGSLSFRDGAGNEIGADEGFAKWKELTVEIRNARRTIYLVGNGASASMASHMASDLSKNAGLHTHVFSDPSLLTAISNDIGYEDVFALPLKGRAVKGDMLVAISSSGKSPNILKAVKVARERDLSVVTLSAKDADNPLRSAGTLNAYVPAETYGLAESCHAAVLHHWMDLVELKS